MGMFDTLNLKCPYCGHINQIQTKVGDCRLNNYNLKNIAPEVFNAFKGVNECEECENNFILEGKVTTIAHIRKYDETIDFYDED